MLSKLFSAAATRRCPIYWISRGRGPFPPRPCEWIFHLFPRAVADKCQALSDRELLTLHAEVLAMRRVYGITYKDAAHRLYMAEVERLKAEKLATNSFSTMVNRMDKTVFHELYPPITAIDQGMFDEMEESYG